MMDQINLGITHSVFEKEFFNGGGGFGINFDSTDKRMPVKWLDIISSPDGVMFFGRSFNGMTSFNELF